MLYLIHYTTRYSTNILHRTTIYRGNTISCGLYWSYDLYIVLLYYIIGAIYGGYTLLLIWYIIRHFTALKYNISAWWVYRAGAVLHHFTPAGGGYFRGMPWKALAIDWISVLWAYPYIYPRTFRNGQIWRFSVFSIYITYGFYYGQAHVFMRWASPYHFWYFSGQAHIPIDICNMGNPTLYYR